MNPQKQRELQEEHDWWLREEMFDYDGYWYEYLSDEDKARYRAYLNKVEPMRDIESEFPIMA